MLANIFGFVFVCCCFVFGVAFCVSAYLGDATGGTSGKPNIASTLLESAPLAWVLLGIADGASSGESGGETNGEANGETGREAGREAGRYTGGQAGGHTGGRPAWRLTSTT